MSPLKQFLLVASAVAVGVLVGASIVVAIVVVVLKVAGSHFGVKLPF